MTETHDDLGQVLQELRDAAADSDGNRVAVGDLFDALDARGYGSVLTILPLVELTPLGGVPGFPTTLALVLAIVTFRLFLGYDHLWVPGWLRRRQLKSDKVEGAVDWLKPVAARIDARLHARLERFTSGFWQRIACVVILALLVTVPPLELVPFATSGPMIVVALFGASILFRDGLLMLFALAGTALLAGILLVMLGP
ncbi:Uncharacterized conserved protein [Loktanella fryxellensis]|uniref:Uncharacterized conserved protein n=1 Tax=Loktanella fryxellensis TaxID=245187 RepID=A0A1H7YW44_9RHOB|nr:exopolysaccharide biosynthesis protein [Loktanella fryxellensis]SEM50472.1 Uncharacterized conserved protein [Loktanella fryxellensis]